ncbi:MAG: T9SS type A sorting domain-containing protein [Bacteroidales bacterium]|jgi:hypothetical protein
MKKNYFITTILMLAFTMAMQFNLVAQDTLVQWTFPTESGLADNGSIEANLLQEIETAGGTSAIQFKNGATTKAAQATEWENGNDAKKWKVAFATTGYSNIKLYSKISSGGQNPGPRDFKVQYKVGSGSWTDVENSALKTANDWTTGAISDLPLSAECNNQADVQIRWIMTSDTASDGTVVVAEGISKIDDIFIVGDLSSGEDEILFNQVVNVFPNPANDYFTVETSQYSKVILIDLTGKQIFSMEVNDNAVVNVSEFKSGVYFLKVTDVNSGLAITKRVLVK